MPNRWAQADPLRTDNKVPEDRPVLGNFGPPDDWEHRELYEAVEAALYAVPAYFRSELNVVDVEAPDLFQFNTPLGGAIELQTVRALNELRSLWDPDSNYPDYTFVRQSQRFPDVVLRSDNPDADPQVLLGIELKGWFALAKEGEPSYRMHVNPEACAPQDLIAVFPWVFENVISGAPRLMRPFVRPAQYAAAMKNWYWQHGRGNLANKEAQTPDYAEITFAQNVGPYPLKSDPIADVPKHDSGNFGRVSRTGIMDTFLDEVRAEPIAGIPVSNWVEFFSTFKGE